MRPSRCGVCGASELRVVSGVRDHVTGEDFDVVQCMRCDFAVTHPVPSRLDRYYPSRYRRFGRLAAVALRWLYLRRVDAWRARLPATGIALEIGAGTGWMLRALREGGWRVVGSERAVGAAVAVRASADVPMFVGDLSAVRPAAVLDLVVMFHVLEHLADPHAALRDVAARLRPGGVLILGLPNIASWQARSAGARWWHLDVPRHLSHFSPRSLERALASADLRMTRVDFRSLEHDPLAWVQAVLDRLGSEQGLLLKVLTGMPRRSGVPSTLAALALALALFPFALALAVASWWAGRGAVMEVSAVREG